MTVYPALSKPPLFVIGNPRSGTTLLRLMLTSHPNIVIPPECGFAVWWLDKYRHWCPASQNKADEALITDICSSRKFHAWGISAKQLRQHFLSSRPRTYPQAVACVYDLYARTKHGRYTRWGDKNNWYLEHIPDINEMFPEARFIHIIRDGRNVACSYRRLCSRDIVSQEQPRLPSEVITIAEQWSRNLATINTSFAQVGWDRVAEVRLEDLKRSPKTELKRLCDHLGEAYSEEMLDFYRQNQEKELEPKEYLQWKEDTISPLIQEEDRRFEEELTADELRAFEQIAHPMLRRYHYAT